MLSYVERRPPAGLRPFLECLWAVWDTRASSGRKPERIVPDGCPELIVHLGDVFTRRIGGRFVRQPRAFLAGTLTRPWVLRAGRRVSTLGIRFRPGALTSLFRLNMDGTANREVSLGELVGARAARELVDCVRRASTRASRFKAAEAWLLEGRASAPPTAGLARPAVEIILRARGQVRIDEVARRLGGSRRRIERAFARDLGIRPKLYARIVRLNAVLATLDEAARERAVDLALDAGYFDQAHLLRDFRALAGRTPRRGRDGDGEMARHFTNPERLRTLLSGE